MAQPGRAPGSGPGGRRFKSSLPDQFISSEYEHCNYQSGSLVVDGNLRPSSDLATHLELYKHFPSVGGVAHTHSEFATAWAQARCTIRCFGITHADSFHGPVPVTEDLTPRKSKATTKKTPGLQSAASSKLLTSQISEPRWRVTHRSAGPRMPWKQRTPR